MRRASAVRAVPVAVALAITGCTSAPSAPPPVPPSVAGSPPVSGSPSASPSPPVDLSLALANPAGYPACGFYFWNQSLGGATGYHLSLGVSVRVVGGNLKDVVDVDLSVDGARAAGARFQGGTLINGTTYSPPGTAVVYLVAEDRPVPPVLVEAPASATVTVTVDPSNAIAETNENNNTITLRVTPTRRRDTRITDNRCTG